jgi:predicted TIM-barrel fold metal-dependent hydrolase
MDLFDCYCSFGELRLKPPRYSKTVEDLLKTMDFCGIKDALVFHSVMKHGSPVIGNRIVYEETCDYKRLFPVWALLPSQTEEQEDPDRFIQSLKARDIRALVAFPDEHGYMLDGVVFGGIFEEMVYRSIPLLLKPKWPLVYTILEQFPKLTVVAIGQGPHGADRYFRPLIERYNNFYIDTSTYLQDGGIEEFCSKYGAERMLFGTGYPGNCIGGPILRILTANIPDEQKELICSKNIRRILENVTL